MNIGARLTRLRLNKHYSQRKLAKLSGVTNSAISSIENNKVSPSIQTLELLLTHLDSSLSIFFGEQLENINPVIVIPEEDLINIGDENVSFKLVYNQSPNRKLGFLIEQYAPHAQTEERISHEGEEAGTVIEGEITIILDNKFFHLKQGDSYVINTLTPHTFKNHTDKITKIISAHTPTTY